MLKLTEVVAHYGPIRALQGISLEVAAGSVVTILGANGAGKSTTLRAISGLIRPTGGTIEFEGKRIDGRSPETIVELGISQVPEGRQIFTQLTVLENLRLGTFARRDKKTVKQDLEEVYHYFPRLGQRQKQVAGTLSGGEQQMLAIGRAMMARPKLLLLDEPSMGLAPLMVERIFDTIREINQQGVTILLVEQNAAQALALASRGYVIETGRIVLEDQAASLLTNEQVRKAYLGEE